MAGSSSKGKGRARSDIPKIPEEVPEDTSSLSEDSEAGQPNNADQRGPESTVHPEREANIPIHASRAQTQARTRTREQDDPVGNEFQNLSQEERSNFLMQSLLTVTRRLEQISEEQSNKRSRSGTLEAANEEPRSKRTAIKAAEFRELYVTKDYTSYCRYVTKVEAQSIAAGLTDAEKLNYAITGLDFTEHNLWEIHRKSQTDEVSWGMLRNHLLHRLGDPENRKRDAWRALFRLRKRPEQNDYEFLDEYNRRIEEIGPDFHDSAKYAAALFVWQFDNAMRDKLDEQEKLPTDLREITAIATRLRPHIRNAAGQRDNAGSKHGSQKNNNRFQGSSDKKGSDKKASDKSADKDKDKDKSDKPSLTPEEKGRFIKENRCFRCGEQGHKSTDCPKKSG